MDDLARILDELFGRHHETLRQYFDRKFHELTQEIRQMSGSLAEQLAVAQAATAAQLDAISTDVTEIGADVDSLLAQLQPGTTITQEMVDAATSISTRVSAIKDGLDAVNAKVPPTP